MKKLFALVLAVAMMLSVAAFATEANECMEPYHKYDETLLITTVKRSDTAPIWPEGQSLDDNYQTRYLKDKLNVEFKTIWEVDANEFNEKLMLDVVADSLPDIWSLSNEDYLIYRQLLENGCLCDLTEAYNTCLNDHLKEIAADFNNKHIEVYTEDGKLMGLPTGRYGYEHNLFWARTDVLEAIGMTADDIKTIDDIHTYFVKGMEAFPDSVGMALNATTPISNYMVQFSADPIAMVYGATPCYWVEQEDGSIVYGSTLPGMKTALGILRDWYAEGIIDKEFATRTGNGLTQALTTGGQAIGWFAPWWYGWSIGDLLDNVEGANVVPINAPLDDEGNFNVPWPSPAGKTCFVNAKFEHPEAIINIYNVKADTGTDSDYQAEATAFTDAGGSVGWEYMDVLGGVNMAYANVVPNFGHAIVAYMENGDTSLFKEPSEITTAENCIRYVNGEYDAARGDYISRVVAATITDADNVKIVYPAFSQTTESAADYKPSLDTLEQQMVLQIIMGEKELDYFDEFVTQWYAEGGQILTDEVNAACGK